MAKAKDKKKKAGVASYWNGIKAEMKKVIWPTREEVISYTAVVVATCAIFALGFWLIDTGVLAALKGVLGVTLN